MNEDFLFYAVCLVAVVVIFFIIKKVASCLIKSLVVLAIAAVLAYVYLMYYQ